MNIIFKRIIFIIFVTSMMISSNAQDNNFNCGQYLTPGFVPFENSLIMEIKEDEMATFHISFYDEFVYRVIACTDINSDLEFSLYDTEKHLLFSNRDYNYSQYWDFIFNSTLDCTIQVKPVDEEKSNATIKLLIGYKLKK